SASTRAPAPSGSRGVRGGSLPAGATSPGNRVPPRHSRSRRPWTRSPTACSDSRARSPRRAGRPTRSRGWRARASGRAARFSPGGLYALLQRDTAGVGGTVTATAGLSGTRASPVSSGSFSLSNGAFGEFRAPFVDGTYDYQDRRLRGAAHLWRSGQQILDVQAYLPLDLALEPVPRRQLPDPLSVGARADSVDLSVLEAL